MKFSIIVPTYNRRLLLQRCLDCLLGQDYPNSDYEVIVVDDGSNDGTREYLESLKFGNLTFLTQDRGGPAKARNFGAIGARGEYLSFTDSDCLVPSGWLRFFEEGFKRWPQAAAIGGYLEAPESVLRINILAQLEGYETHEIYNASNQEYLGGFESPAGGTNNITYRRSVFEKLGGFDESFPVPAGEDADLKLRAVKAGYQIGYLPVKVTHLDPYTFRSFIKRSIISGIGSAYFEKKHYEIKPDRLKFISTVSRDFANLFLVPFKPLRIGDQRLSVWICELIIIKSFLINYGKVKFWLNRAPERLLVK